MDLDAPKITDLFEAAKPDLMVIPASSLERPRISRERALYMTRILRREIAPVLPLLPLELSAERAKERRADYEHIETRVYVYYASDLAIETPWTSDKKSRRKELVRRVREHDRHLSSWAIPVFRKDDKARAAVAAILRGRGLRDDAEDTLKLVDLFRQNWGNVKEKVPMTTTYLSEADAEARELIQLLDAIDSDEPGSPRDLRKRAFTAWVQGYRELFYAGCFLLRGDLGAVQRLSVISPERTAADDEEDEAEEDAGESNAAPPHFEDGPKTERDGDLQ